MSESIPAELTLMTISGRVALRPMRPEHAAGLFAAMDDAELWRLRPDPRPKNVAAMEAFIHKRMAEVATGERRPFVVTMAATGEIVGTTGYLAISEGDRSLEIGATCLSPRVQRTFVNTECKLALMTHAFEAWRANRVYFKVDTRNERSQAAVLRLGAVKEGVLRKSRVCHDGYIRDTAVFSVIREEWAGVKARLEGLLRR